MRRLFSVCVSLAPLALATVASAQGASRAAPDSSPPPSAAASGEEDEEVVVDVTTAVSQLPVLLITAATEADRPLAEEVRKQVELTGQFDTVPVDKLGLGMPERNTWPGLALAAVVIERDPRTPPQFPAVRSTTWLRGIKDEVRRRELTEFPGAGALTSATMADAVLEDVLGTRSNMSGRLLVTDASTVGERSVRVMGPDGTRGRRISGFDNLARGGDFGPSGLVSYAAEDANGKLALFREGQRSPVPLPVPGYVQGVSWAPDGSRVALSMGVGRKVTTWIGPSLDSLHAIDVGERISLSPSINSDGDVVHAVGPEQGPFSVFVKDKPLTPAGAWAATPSFCSLGADKRVVYAVRNGAHWDVRITSITTGLTRTVAVNGMAPACSPDGRTVAYYSPSRAGKGPGVYLIGDQGGTPHKTWSGTVAALRWAKGEQLPPRTVEPLALPATAPTR